MPAFPLGVSIVCRKITAHGTFHHSDRTDIILAIPPLRFAPHARRVAGVAAYLLAAAHPAAIAAQAVSDLGDEARTLPGGVIRFDVSESDTRYDLQYGPNGLRPLGAALSVDSLGVTQLPILRPTQSAVQGLLGDPNYRLTLGNMLVESSMRVSNTPLTLEIGLTHWLTIRGSVPIVRALNTVFFNPNSTLSGNIGINPALAFAAARDTDGNIYTQFVQAGGSLRQDLSGCQANSASASYCSTLLAQQSAAQALIAQSNAFASNFGQVYGTGAGTPGAVVPTGTSYAQAAIVARILGFSRMYAHFDSLTGGPRITTLVPIPAAPLAFNDAQTILATSLLGLSADSIESTSRSGLGDITLSATLQLFDSFRGNDSARTHPHGVNFRLAITGEYRRGTGAPIDPGAYLGLGSATGTGTNAVGVHAATDLLIGPHFWTSMIARVTTPLTNSITLRIPLDPANVYVPSAATQTVQETLGRLLDLEIDPHYTLNDYFGVTLHYRYLHKAADQYVGMVHLDSAATGSVPATLNANILDAGTSTTETRWGLGVTYSTVAATTRGHGHLPFDILVRPRADRHRDG